MILHTTDGGTVMDRINVSVKANLYALVFIDADLGFACGSGGIILRTVNGGETREDANSGGLWCLGLPEKQRVKSKSTFELCSLIFAF